MTNKTYKVIVYRGTEGEDDYQEEVYEHISAKKLGDFVGTFALNLTNIKFKIEFESEEA